VKFLFSVPHRQVELTCQTVWNTIRSSERGIGASIYEEGCERRHVLCRPRSTESIAIAYIPASQQELSDDCGWHAKNLKSWAPEEP
jgi:hypothetical protein